MSKNRRKTLKVSSLKLNLELCPKELNSLWLPGEIALFAKDARKMNDTIESALAGLCAKAELAQQRQLPTALKYGERVLLLILSKEDRENMIGDLAEEYTQISARHGQQFTGFWYWKQVCASILFMLPKAIRRSVFAWIEEWVRRPI